MKATITPSWWLDVPRDAFSAKCCDYFQTNFNHSDKFIVRSEFIKTKGSSSHLLVQGHRPLTPDTSVEGRRQARARSLKHVGTRLSAKAMRSGSLLEGRHRCVNSGPGKATKGLSMRSVAASPTKRQPMSSLTPEDRVRQQIAREVAPDIVLAIYRAMKGNRLAKFEQISTVGLAVLATEVNELLSSRELHRRILLINQLEAHDHAAGEDDQATAICRANADRRRASDLTAIKAIVPGMCCLCATPIAGQPAGVLQITEALKADVHERCAQQHKSVEIVSSFSFRLKGGE